MVSGVPFLFLILNVWNGQVSMKDGKILNFHKFSLAWSNIWCYNLKQQYIKVSVEAKAGWEPSWLLLLFRFICSYIFAEKGACSAPGNTAPEDSNSRLSYVS